MANLILPDPRMEMPELLEPGRKPIGHVEIDKQWQYLDNVLIGYITGANLLNNSFVPLTLTASAGVVGIETRRGIQATGMDLVGYQHWTHGAFTHDIQSSGATLVCRFYCDSIEAWGGVFCMGGNAANDRFEITKNSLGKIYLQYQNSWQKTFAYDFPIGKWVTFVGVKHGGQQTLSLWFAPDGESVQADSATGLNVGVSRTYQRFYIGASPTGLTSRRFDGLLDHAYVLDHAVDESAALRIIANPYQFLIPA